MAKRSKFFCIAVEGATCDGRSLDRNALQEMAETYDPKTYSARVNMEHIRGFSAEPPFNAYGDVVALETREVELQLGGKAEKKLGLFAQVDALDSLVAIQGKGQKLFSSIELNPNFASTGKAYLQGLAVTDSPASLGTEIMEFAAGQVKAGKTSVFAERKIEKGNFFSAAHEVDALEFQDAKPSEQDGLFADLRALIKTIPGFSAKSDDADSSTTPPPPPPAPSPTPSPANDNFAALIAQTMDKFASGLEASNKAMSDRMDKQESAFAAFQKQMEGTPNGAPRRPAATGDNANFARTDC